MLEPSMRHSDNSNLQTKKILVKVIYLIKLYVFTNYILCIIIIIISQLSDNNDLSEGISSLLDLDETIATTSSETLVLSIPLVNGKSFHIFICTHICNDYYFRQM